ncbi:hypothetical protein [Gordonia humi]|uniref:MFS family permease n=1 Tax=Gordonia humi TaxID=686429 RepID=A0A840F256_9ACTN|nr:hypothetical protein [Gordonia humi]MBB4137971.1 MFS family permease [Gordonia humi]
MGTILTVVLCGGLLTIGIWRLLHIPSRPSVAWWAYTQTFLFAALAKLARTPNLADRWAEPALYKLTHVHNVMTLVGMTLGALVAVPAVLVMLDLTGRRSSLRLAAAIQAVIAAAMIISFAASAIPQSPASSYITATVPMPWDAATWSYWAVFLGSIGAAGLVNLILAVQAFIVVRRGSFAVALLGWAITAGAACLYIANKIVNLAVQQVQGDQPDESWYLHNVSTISLTLLLLVVGSFGITLSIYPLHRLPTRWRRYRLLRKRTDEWKAARSARPDAVLPNLPVPDGRRRHLWSAARNPIAAYSLQVELADTNNAC